MGDDMVAERTIRFSILGDADFYVDTIGDSNR